MELSTALIWGLRIILPIVLFCIYFKLQDTSTSESKAAAQAGPSGNQISRSRLLALRAPAEGTSAPPVVKGIRLVGAEEAPHLFVDGRRKRRDQAGDAERGDRKERRDKRERGGKRPDRVERSNSDGAGVVEMTAPPPVVQPEVEVEVKPSLPELSPEEEKMHLESLINYMALQKKAQEGPQQSANAAEPAPEEPSSPPQDAAAPDASSAEVANAEAQTVLIGAIKYKRVDVARKLFEQLTSKKVTIDGKTFDLMIESCLAAGDLPTVSDLLQKMEESGHAPSSEVLDKAMKLYNEHKATRVAEASAVKGTVPTIQQTRDASSEDATREAGRTALRAKLSSEAMLFVPGYGGFGMPPPPGPFQPPPPPGPHPGMVGKDKAAETPVEEVGGRTALKRESKAFEPQGMPVFTPYGMPGWSEDGFGKGGSGDAGDKKSNGKPGGEKKPGRKEKASREDAEDKSGNAHE
eukprot:TRINITY_DN110894_c0_g1_i1.p1 TRINITY_DN110894_c0_g1~~TRINITY_DN110894_c0_g1_i1.p1  ORF type:complete len:465 (+),score=114.78 TRINITY_DN110894_c0_g1_i1:133-1527(+)